MMLVSVVIPSFNRQHLVLETIRSVQNQSESSVEIIVVDDGSTDDTKGVLRPYAEKGDIRYFRQENSGQAAARNRGLLEARGEFVSFIDDDDLWPADKIQWQLAELRERADVDLVGGDVTTDLAPVETTQLRGEPTLIDGEFVFYACPFLSLGQTLMRTAAVRSIGGFSSHIRGVEDFDFYVRLARKRPLLRVPRLALQYRDHGVSFSKDYLKMLQAGGICLRDRIPEVPLGRRWQMSRRAYRGLYNTFGKAVLQSLLIGTPLNGTKKSEAWRIWFRELWRGVLTDPRLAVEIISAVISTKTTNAARLN